MYFRLHYKAESCIYAVKTLSRKLALDLHWCGAGYFYIAVYVQHSQARCFSSLLLSCTCYSRPAVALLFIALFELHCSFTFFLASVTNMLVKIYENNCLSSFNSQDECSSGSRSALDNCPKNTQLPVGQLFAKTQERCFLFGMLAMESVHVCLRC